MHRNTLNRLREIQRKVTVIENKIQVLKQQTRLHEEYQLTKKHISTQLNEGYDPFVRKVLDQVITAYLNYVKNRSSKLYKAATVKNQNGEFVFNQNIFAKVLNQFVDSPSNLSILLKFGKVTDATRGLDPNVPEYNEAVLESVWYIIWREFYFAGYRDIVLPDTPLQDIGKKISWELRKLTSSVEESYELSRGQTREDYLADGRWFLRFEPNYKAKLDSITLEIYRRKYDELPDKLRMLLSSAIVLSMTMIYTVIKNRRGKVDTDWNTYKYKINDITNELQQRFPNIKLTDNHKLAISRTSEMVRRVAGSDTTGMIPEKYLTKI